MGLEAVERWGRRQ